MTSAHQLLCSTGVFYGYYSQGSLFTPVTTGVFSPRLKSILLNGNQRIRTSSKPENHSIMPPLDGLENKPYFHRFTFTFCCHDLHDRFLSNFASTPQKHRESKEHEKVIKESLSSADKRPFLPLILLPDVEFRARKTYKPCYMMELYMPELANIGKVSCDNFMVQW